MDKKTISVGGLSLPLIETKAVVVGSGCAGWNAADCLAALGVDTAVVTEGVRMGTSRNTGSDKQTYYKLSLASDEPDSVGELAKTLFSGGGVDGDTALCEAAGSVRCFMKLVQLGVPFPTNRYGEYAGYRTDHDPRRRATSCGPLTSKRMTEALEASARRRGVPVLDRLTAVRLLTDGDGVHGLLCLDAARTQDEAFGLTVIKADAVVLLCPNYNDALSANLTAAVNRLTALYRTVSFQDKAVFALVVSGYSGGDIVASQIVSAMNMNKGFWLPAGFCMLETANDKGEALALPGIRERAAAFAGNLLSQLTG